MFGLVSLRRSAFVLPTLKGCFYDNLKIVLSCRVFEARTMIESLEGRRDLLAIFDSVLKSIFLFELQ